MFYYEMKHSIYVCANVIKRVLYLVYRANSLTVKDITHTYKSLTKSRSTFRTMAAHKRQRTFAFR